MADMQNLAKLDTGDPAGIWKEKIVESQINLVSFATQQQGKQPLLFRVLNFFNLKSDTYKEDDRKNDDRQDEGRQDWEEQDEGGPDKGRQDEGKSMMGSGLFGNLIPKDSTTIPKSKSSKPGSVRPLFEAEVRKIRTML